MAKFCGACGKRNEDDNAMRCCKCGAFFPDMIKPPTNNNGYGNYSGNLNNNNSYVNYNGNLNNNNPSNQSVNYIPIQQPNRSNQSKNIIKTAAVYVLAAMLVLFCVYAYKYTGYRASLTHFKTYFDNYEYDRIVDNYSTVIFDTSNPDDNYAELDDDAKAKLDSIFDYFDSEIGDNGYSLKFETVENYRMTDNEYDDFMNGIDYARKNDVILDARVAEFKITASLDGKKSSKNVELILTLEDENKWKIYSFNEKQ